MSRHYAWLLFILTIMFGAVWLILPNTTRPDFLLRGGDKEALAICERDPEADCTQFKGDFEFQQGLDLVGGLRVLLQAELPPEAFTLEDLKQTANSVTRRINPSGTIEVTVQTQGNNRILVELPGVTDPEAALRTIQQTALLEFVDFTGLDSRIGQLQGQRILTNLQLQNYQARERLAAEQGLTLEEMGVAPLPTVVNPLNGQPFVTVMTGDGLQAAVAMVDPQSNRWLIQFEVKPEYQSIFGEYTAQASINGEPMAIVLDGVVLSAPSVGDRLDTGGVITSPNFTQETAQELALQLRSGALAIPLRVESSELVGATLGNESIQLSIRAGIIGAIVVLIFMFVYYRVPGIAADLALIVFITLNLFFIKLIPLTLTLPAITGLLISIGTAVDGNILIFERIKEELRDGKSLMEALEAGFDRAWTSIRDSNLSTIIICGILFLFGQTPGASLVAGFALTLALGLVINLFTAVLVTRTFLFIIVKLLEKPIEQRKWLVGI
ncbi:MAG TPA: protein translocase subunit SecD [Aggregatilineales bacterium]|nr:protein translocase subunit SecD [Aggregatilineales bacterium]